MAKKMTQRFSATLKLNPESAGAWMAEVAVSNVYLGPNIRLGSGNENEVVIKVERSAWKNASAGKRWIKSQVLELTPRKSVKLVINEEDATTKKPISLLGLLEYKVPETSTMVKGDPVDEEHKHVVRLMQDDEDAQLWAK